MSKYKGVFIAIEGGDGLGKSTLINKLKSIYKDAIFTHEPGGNDFCEKVRSLIMDSIGLSKETEMYLFCASRSEFVDKVVLPNISQGKMVITDRYVYSSYVYQGILAGLGVENVEKANAMAVKNVVPDVVICLKGAKSFRTGNENRFDNQTSDETAQIYKGFDLISKKFNNFATINVENLTEEEVFYKAVEIINKAIKYKEKEQEKING